VIDRHTRAGHVDFSDLNEKPKKETRVDRTKRAAWISVLLYAVLIFILSSRPDLPDMDFFIEINDKVAHIILYTPLGFLLRRALSLHKNMTAFQTAVLTLIIGVLYGISDELHQAFVPGRYADAADVLADAVGVLFGSTAFYFLRKQQPGLRAETNE